MRKTIFLISLLSLLFFQCEDTTINPESDSLYFNSFETEADVEEWEGAFNLAEDSAPKGGDKSLRVSGGCVVPHVDNFLFKATKSTSVSVNCWGKTNAFGGSFTVFVDGRDSKQVTIAIDSKDWEYYEGEESLKVTKGDDVRIRMAAGGFVPSDMLVDLLVIKEE